MFKDILTVLAPYVFPTIVAAVIYVYTHLPLKRQQELDAKTTYLRGLMLDIVTTVEKTSAADVSGVDKALMARSIFEQAIKALHIELPPSVIVSLLEPAVAAMKVGLVPSPPVR